MSTEPRYQTGTVDTVGSIHTITTYAGARYDTEIYDMHTDPAAPIATCDTSEEAEHLCDLLNAGEQARELATAVAGLGAHIGSIEVYHIDGKWVPQGLLLPEYAHAADTPAAAIVALWQAVQATGEGE